MHYGHLALNSFIFVEIDIVMVMMQILNFLNFQKVKRDFFFVFIHFCTLPRFVLIAG